MAEIFVDAAYGSSHPRGSGGEGTSSYPTLELSVGVLRRFRWDGAVTAEAGYNRLSGGPQVLGAYRNLLFVRAGYRQTFLRYLYAGVRVGTGYNDFHIDFGAPSVPLPDETPVPVLFSAEVGAQYCFGRHPCVEAGIAPFYERGVAGVPAYDNRGLLAVAALRFDIGRTVPYEEHESALARAGGERLPAVAAVCPEVSPAVEPPPCPESPPPPPCPVCPPPPPPPPATPERGILAIVSENPLRMPIIFTNESPQLSEREERVRRVRIGLSDPWLDRVADYLKSHSNVGVRIHGHANDTGPEDQNVAISEQRARAVASYLRRHGVPAGQILPVVGHGSSSPPVESNPADPLNRSVVFEEVHLK